MKIRFLGAHNCETSTTRLPGILVDDRLALDAGSLTSSLSLEEQLKLTAVLLTHRHFDHVRDIPTVAMNCFLNQGELNVYGSADILESLTKHFLNGEVYSRFVDRPFFHFRTVEPGVEITIGGYRIVPVAMPHSVPATGFQVMGDETDMFYAGDTGTGLASALGALSPQLIIVEVTASNRWTEFARTALHLTPDLLRLELEEFRSDHSYLPRVVAVHMNPSLEDEIVREIEELASALGGNIELAREGWEISL